MSKDATLQKYYASLESRLGYQFFLNGTRHFGFYTSSKSFPFPIGRALRRMEARLYDALNLEKDSQVLDAGCGVGHVAIYLAGRGLVVRAIDLVSHHLSEARKNVQRSRLQSRIQLSWADYHDLHIFNDESFDGVCTMETFVHATDPHVALKEFARVLKSGGKLALFEYNHASSSELPSEVIQKMKLVNQHAAMPANQSFEPGVLEQLLNEAGFQDIQVEDISQNILPMLRLFYIAAYIPYCFIRLFRLQSYFINTMAAVEGYIGMKKHWTRYIIITAVKSDDNNPKISDSRSSKGR